MVVLYKCISQFTLDRHPASASARLPNAIAIFSRDGNAAELRLEIQTPTVAAYFELENIEQAVARCCEQEISFVRNAFDKLGDLLRKQLDDRGDRAQIHDTVDWNEKRSWRIERGTFKVAGTRQRAESRIDITNDPSDAALMREMIRIQLSGRIHAIRDVYREMLDNLRRSRSIRSEIKTV